MSEFKKASKGDDEEEIKSNPDKIER